VYHRSEPVQVGTLHNPSPPFCFLHFHQTFVRNSIIGDKYRWPTTIPYYLEDNLGRKTCTVPSHVVMDTHQMTPLPSLTRRYECKGSDPEGVRPVQTEDVHRLHAVERRGELHLGVQRQRVSSEKLSKLRRCVPVHDSTSYSGEMQTLHPHRSFKAALNHTFCLFL